MAWGGGISGPEMMGWDERRTTWQWLRLESGSGQGGISGSMLHWNSPKCRLSLTSLPAVVATTLKNANASLVYSFLYKIVEVGSGLLLAGSSVCPPVLPASFGIHPT